MTKTKQSVKLGPAERRLGQVNRSMTHGVQLERDGLWIEFGERVIHLYVREHLKRQIWTTLGGGGDAPAKLAKRLSFYGWEEHQRRFGNCFPEWESDFATLEELTDHTWPVIPIPQEFKVLAKPKRCGREA